MSVPKTMKAVQVRGGKGASDKLYIGDVDVPQLRDGEVLVRVHTAGVNRMDCLEREGQYPVPAHSNGIMGVEYAGKVVASNAADGPAVGDEVFGLTVGGCYAEYVAAPASMLLPKPAELSFEECAAVPEVWLTAYQALFWLNNLKKGEDVLIHAGASSVGLAAVQLARRHGARNIYVTAGSQEKIETCKSVGATDGINYKDGDWAEKLKSLTSDGGVDVILDFLGASYFAQNLASLKRDGRMSMQGFMGGVKVDDTSLAPILMKRLRITGSTLRSRDLDYQGRLLQELRTQGIIDALVKAEQDNKHRIVIHKVFDLAQVKEAHDMMESNQNSGKIVLRVVKD